MSVGRRGLSKAYVPNELPLRTGVRFEFNDRMVEIVSVHNNLIGTQLEVTEV